MLAVAGVDTAGFVAGAVEGIAAADLETAAAEVAVGRGTEVRPVGLGTIVAADHLLEAAAGALVSQSQVYGAVPAGQLG